MDVPRASAVARRPFPTGSYGMVSAEGGLEVTEAAITELVSRACIVC